MKIKITSFTYQLVQEGVRISFSYSELNEDGDIISSNNRKSFIITDETILIKLKDIKKYLENTI